MVARSTPPFRDVGTGAGGAPQEIDPDSAGKPYEPVQPAEAPRKQVLALAPSPRLVATIGGGIAAAFAGGAVGYWLGKRHARRPARPIRKIATTVHSVMDLAPVAVRLMANPLVRALVLRMVLLQIARRIDH